MASSIVDKIIFRIVTSFLRSVEDTALYSTWRHFKDIQEINSNWIPTYPRFTIHCLNEMGLDYLVFDSSDFEVINKAFGVFGSLTGKSIRVGKIISVYDVKYQVEEVDIDLISVFDDYSDQRHLNGQVHTEAYEGRDVPYNIQIILRVKAID